MSDTVLGITQHFWASHTLQSGLGLVCLEEDLGSAQLAGGPHCLKVIIMPIILTPCMVMVTMTQTLFIMGVESSDQTH